MYALRQSWLLPAARPSRHQTGPAPDNISSAAGRVSAPILLPFFFDINGTRASDYLMWKRSFFAVVVIFCRVIRHNPISSFVPLNQSLSCASCSCQFWGITSICYFCCCLCTTFGRGVRGARRACVVSLFRRFKSVMSRLSIVLRIVHVFYKEIEIYCTYSHFNSLVQSQSICQGYKQGICGATDALLCCRREFRRDFILVLLWFSLLLLIFHGSMFLCGFVP